MKLTPRMTVNTSRRKVGWYQHDLAHGDLSHSPGLSWCMTVTSSKSVCSEMPTSTGPRLAFSQANESHERGALARNETHDICRRTCFQVDNALSGKRATEALSNALSTYISAPPPQPISNSHCREETRRKIRCPKMGYCKPDVKPYFCGRSWYRKAFGFPVWVTCNSPRR